MTRTRIAPVEQSSAELAALTLAIRAVNALRDTDGVTDISKVEVDDTLVVLGVMRDRKRRALAGRPRAPRCLCGLCGGQG